MLLPRFSREPDEAVVAGVCAGIARTLGVDPTLVRLVFTLLALAGGAGVLLYLALWALDRGWRPTAVAPRPLAGVVLAALGALLVLSRGGVHAALLTPGAVAGSLLLIGGPLLWRLALARDAERAARIRTEERAEVAARVHDSVLQTLALIQRDAQAPRRVASLARRQERELRGWVYGERSLGAVGSLVGALSAVAAEGEQLHGV